MGAHQFPRYRKAETAAARSGRAEKWTKQVLPRLGRQSGAIIGDLDRDGPVLRRSRKTQPMGSSLDGIAGEVEKDPVELIAVGHNREIDRYGVFDRQISLGNRQTRPDFV